MKLVVPPSRRLSGWLNPEDMDLVARILGPVGSPAAQAKARHVLEAAGSLADLACMRTEGPRRFSLSPAQWRRLQAALELAGRLSVPASRRTLNKPDAVFELSGDLRVSRREHFVGFYVDTKNSLLARRVISTGTLDSSLVHPREVFEPAVRLSAYGVIVAHNHPSGDPAPSDDDLAITRRLGEAAELLGIHLLDHVIVARSSFVSLHAEGYL